MKKILSTSLIILILVLSGCSDNYSEAGEPGQQPQNQSETWQSFSVIKASVYSTEDWQKFNLFAESGDTGFSFKFPKVWTMGTNIIKDQNNQKIAELLPGVIQLKENQSCFDAQFKDDSGKSELLKQEKFEVNNMKGVKRIFTSMYEGEEGNGFWYPVKYCLQERDKAYIFSFYEKDLSFEYADLSERVISTFNFLQ